MENSRFGFLLLLVLGILIAIGSLVNHSNNITSRYGYLLDTVVSLDQAENAQAFEEKRVYIYESIQVYQQGPNLVKLQALASLKTAEQIDALLSAVKDSLNAEYSAHIYTFSGIKFTLLELAFIVTTLFATIENYKKWSRNKRHFFIAITFALLFAICMLLLP